MMFQFEVPGIPQGKQRVRVSQHDGYAVAYTPQKTVHYENLIKLCYRTQCKSKLLLCGPLQMAITAIYAIPKSMSKKKVEMALNGQLRPIKKPDLDNIAKAVCDALNQVAYCDDSQIVNLSISKQYGLIPKVIITISEVKDNGVT